MVWLSNSQSSAKYVVNVTLDRSFVKMEKRGLTFLLQGEAKELYLDFLQKPAMYRDWIREIEAKEDWV